MSRSTGRAIRPIRARAVLGAALAALFLAPAGVHAQGTVADMIEECRASSPLFFNACNNAVLALAATRAGIGLAASQGSAVPGSASTLGRRMASAPRLAFSLRGGAARARYGDPDAGRVRTFWPLSLEGQLTVGVLEGWSPLPTVGGFLSLDLLAEVGVVSPSSDGFEGAAHDLGYGARIGVFRESFTLPGVSAAFTRRHLGELTWGSEAGGSTRLAFTPTVTSVRATAAKDLLSFGVLGGWGWDRYGGQSSVSVQVIPPGGPLTADASSDEFHTDRQLIFGGLSYTLLVFQLSAEAGWASGFEGPIDASSGYKPRKSSFFGSIAARLTY
jgi:hypothetical protein